MSIDRAYPENPCTLVLGSVNKNDNRIENLEIRDRKHHHPHSHLEERIKQLELRTIQLEADNCRLEKLVQVGVNING